MIAIVGTITEATVPADIPSRLSHSKERGPAVPLLP